MFPARLLEIALLDHEDYAPKTAKCAAAPMQSIMSIRHHSLFCNTVLECRSGKSPNMSCTDLLMQGTCISLLCLLGGLCKICAYLRPPHKQFVPSTTTEHNRSSALEYKAADTGRRFDMAASNGMVNPAVFQDLQARIDEDTAVRDVRRSSNGT